MRLDENNGNYTITLLQNATSSEFTTFFRGHFDVMKAGNITIDGKELTISNNGALTGGMLSFGGSGFTRGTLPTFNSATGTWEGSDYGVWFGYDKTLTFKNVKFEGSENGTGLMLFYIVMPKTDIVFDSCDFKWYQKAAIWAANFESMTIKNCDFDGTKIQVEETDPTLYKQSSEHISLCLGDEFRPTTSSYNTHRISAINITDNTFSNINKVSSNGTSAIKIKIKNYTIINGIDDILVKGNTFTNNSVDFIVGEKNPETAYPSSRPTTADESANFNVIFQNNISNNAGGIKIQSVHNSSVPEADRTFYIPSRTVEHVAYNGAAKILLKQSSNEKEAIIESETNLEDAISFIDDIDEIEYLVIEEDGYDIVIDKSNIKNDRTGTVTDLSLNITTNIPNNLKNVVKDGSVIISSNESGSLPASKITIRTKIAKYANKTVELFYFNETTNKLESVGKYKADSEGNLQIILSHYSTYVLEEVAVSNPKTADNIINSVIIGTFSLSMLLGIELLLKKKKYN